MDSLYKPHFVRSVKEAMAAWFPEFVGRAIPRGHPMRAIFAGDLAYRASVPATRASTVWLRWVP